MEVHMEWWLGVGTAVLAFLGGLLGPALRNLVDSLVASKVGQRERVRQLADDRSRQAAEACYEELASLQDLIPALRSQEHRTRSIKATQDDYDRLSEIRAKHVSAIARLEANSVLLADAPRAELDFLIDILRYADDLTYNANAQTDTDQGWHPDSASQIARNLAAHGRAVLANYLKGQGVPPRPEVVKEYALAVDDRNEFFTEYFDEEIREDGDAIRTWRINHGLAPERSGDGSN